MSEIGTVPFRFKSASCVVVGTFNIYVLQPPLLASLGLIRNQKSHVKLEANLTQPGFRFSSEELNATWTVKPDKVVVQTVDPQKDCGADMATVLEALKWTPITAIGTNVEFLSKELPDGVLSDSHTSIRNALGSEGQEGIVQTTCHFSVRLGEHICNFQVAGQDSEFELSINVHSDLINRGDQPTTNHIAQQIARRFFSQRQEVTSLIHQKFSLEFADDSDGHEVIQHDHGIGRATA